MPETRAIEASRILCAVNPLSQLLLIVSSRPRVIQLSMFSFLSPFRRSTHHGLETRMKHQAVLKLKESNFVCIFPESEVSGSVLRPPVSHQGDLAMSEAVFLLPII